MIKTVYGNVIDPFIFSQEQITVGELAHSLACQNRFFGHAKFPISIAQHAVSVSLLSQGHELQGLHHDDSEALLGDMNKWLKESDCMLEYRKLETFVQTELYLKFGCEPHMTETVKQADRLAVRCEMAFAFGRYYKSQNSEYNPPTVNEMDHFLDITHFREMSWKEAELAYLHRHYLLIGEYKI